MGKEKKDKGKKGKGKGEKKAGVSYYQAIMGYKYINIQIFNKVLN